MTAMTARILAALVLALLVPGTPAVAQRQAALERVIVQFHDDAALDGFSAQYSADEREARSPHLFGYQSRAVLGAIKALERHYGFRAHAFYSRAIRGFAALVTPAQRAALERHPLVKIVEDDRPVQLVPAVTPLAQTVPWGMFKTGADISSTRSGDGSGTVTGVNVYVIDSGVDPTHPDINLVQHVNFAGGVNEDCNGHGTGVAGLIAARDNGDFSVGVAPGLPVTAVKVVTCAGLGFPSIIVQGVDWVTANAVKPAVANMSLGSLIPLSTVNNAVRASAASGIFYALAAGNGNPFTGAPLNACNTSPALVGRDPGFPNGIIAVGATGQDDDDASFSNFGPCVELWAPGVALESTWLMAEGGLITASGTSFASPMVAGAAALLLSRFPTLPMWLVEYYIRAAAEVPGTTAHDGAAIRRLFVAPF
jgi:subtilisin family serine protease